MFSYLFIIKSNTKIVLFRCLWCFVAISTDILCVPCALVLNLYFKDKCVSQIQNTWIIKLTCNGTKSDIPFSDCLV